MSRLPIRIRLTLAFALMMAAVLGVVGVLLYVRLGDSLSEQIDNGLQSQADAVSAVVREQSGELPGELATQDDEGFTQVVSSAGTLLASSSIVSAGSLLSPEELSRGRTQSFYAKRDSLPGLDGAARLLVTPLDGEQVLVVGASLEDREEALDGLVAQLFIVGPVALLLSSGAGYLLAAAALRPVEAMRAKAAAVSSTQPGQRLPLPAARDEVYRLSETLNGMLDRLEASMARERRFVADASHELRTPLALLQTELELALRRPRTSEDLERALRSAADEVDQLARLAEDLLVLARIDEGGLPLQRTTVSARELLGTVVWRFESRAEAAGRALMVVAEDDVSIVGDRLRLEQALGNLVDNALRHGAGTIHLEVDSHDDTVELRVSDEGTGVPPAFLPRAFDRFTRADEARGAGGAGLGLAIVEAIARAHGGTARASNAVGSGAVVSLVLPRISRP